MLRSCPLFLAAAYFPLRYIVSKRLVIQTVEILTGKVRLNEKIHIIICIMVKNSKHFVLTSSFQ